MYAYVAVIVDQRLQKVESPPAAATSFSHTGFYSSLSCRFVDKYTNTHARITIEEITVHVWMPACSRSACLVDIVYLTHSLFGISCEPEPEPINTNDNNRATNARQTMH